MTFSEAMDALLEGNKIRQRYWRDEEYIMLNSRGDIIDNFGKVHNINSKTDLMLRWELYQPKVTVGALLSRGENQYRVVLNEAGWLEFVDTKTWKVFIEIPENKFDDAIRAYSMKVINDSSID